MYNMPTTTDLLGSLQECWCCAKLLRKDGMLEQLNGNAAPYSFLSLSTLGKRI